MKRIFIILFIGIFIIPSINSCKKGDGDPVISFKSRDARLCQTWVLTKIEGNKVSSGITTTISYDGTNFSAVKSNNTSETGTGTFEITFNKEGTLDYTEAFLPTGGVADNGSGTGNWVWAGSGKNKSSLYLLHIDANLFDANIYSCYKLSSKELILIYRFIEITDGDTYSYDETYTFEKKK